MKRILPGHFVKIRRDAGEGGERFWVMVERVDGDTITGVVNNNLVFTKLHGLRCGDRVEFARDEVLDWMHDVRH
jgi:uncharacterized protein YegJ (DUF2314 family)